jgi:hypothetical protein
VETGLDGSNKHTSAKKTSWLEEDTDYRKQRIEHVSRSTFCGSKAKAYVLPSQGHVCSSILSTIKWSLYSGRHAESMLPLYLVCPVAFQKHSFVSHDVLLARRNSCNPFCCRSRQRRSVSTLQAIASASPNATRVRLPEQVTDR